MLGKEYECRQNRCAKPIWKQRSPVLSWRGESAGNQSDTARPQGCWKRANGGGGQLRKSDVRLAGQNGGRGQLRKSGLRTRQRRSGNRENWEPDLQKPAGNRGRTTLRELGRLGTNQSHSWSQAKDGRSCGRPTGEFAPVKVENEFADGKIC